MERHQSSLIWLHWLSALLVAAAVALVLLREGIESRDTRSLLMFWHSQVGAALLTFSALRLILRRRNAAPTALDHGWLRYAAQAAHVALYGLLLGLPMLGIAALQARGKNVSVAGLFDLPVLLARDRDLSETLSTIHEYLAWTLVGLVGVHVGAALWHQFVRRDGVLLRMWPRRNGGDDSGRDDDDSSLGALG